MSEELLENLSSVINAGLEASHFDTATREEIQRVVRELETLQAQGLPAFTTAPPPSQCPACGQNLYSQVGTGEI